MDMISNKILDICHNYYKYLMSLENVVGICISHKKINNVNTLETCVNVLVSKKVDKNFLSYNNIIPKTYMGLRTDVTEVGALKPYMGQEVIGKFRPLISGCQIYVKNSDGQYNSGTLGGFVYKTINDVLEYYILSASHLLSDYGKLPIGSPIIQSNPLKDFSSKDYVAHLTSFIPIINSDNFFTFNNEVDAAIAKVNLDEQISKQIFRIGTIDGVSSANLDENIKMVGAYSGFTEGIVIGTHATIKLKDRHNKINSFKNQIMLDIEGQPGDSGALILNDDDEAIGLLIGGNAITEKAYASDINIILNKFNAELYTDTD